MACEKRNFAEDSRFCFFQMERDQFSLTQGEIFAYIVLILYCCVCDISCIRVDFQICGIYHVYILDCFSGSVHEVILHGFKSYQNSLAFCDFCNLFYIFQKVFLCFYCGFSKVDIISRNHNCTHAQINSKLYGFLCNLHCFLSDFFVRIAQRIFCQSTYTHGTNRKSRLKYSFHNFFFFCCIHEDTIDFFICGIYAHFHIIISTFFCTS